MTRAAWERTITDSAGNVLTGVQIAVFQQDGTTPATIYGQLSGGAALSNPFNTGVQTSAKFYADPGRYVIRAVKDGQTKEFTDVDIADKAIRDDVGTAAYLTATTSARDATEGRALRVRDFGVGSNAVQVSPAELDGITANGFYSVVGASQAPTTDPYEVQHIQFDANSAKQIAYEAGTTLTRVFVRVKGGAIWQPWRKIYNSSDVVGLVGFAGGVNTGAIIDQGSNANGEYTKFADGTLICRFTTAAIYGPVTNDTGANLIYSGPIAWNYPAIFASTPTCFYTPGPANFNEVPLAWPTGAVKLGAGSAGTSADGNIYVTFSKMGGTKASVQCLAVGRWR